MASQTNTQNGSNDSSDLVGFDEMAKKYDKMASGASTRVAKHILTLIPPITPTSVVLDNAAGTGIVTREVLASFPPGKPSPTIYAVDLAPAMINSIQSRIHSAPSQWSNVTAQTMPAEDLAFSDNTFTHSITNFGIMFFTDTNKGASEIYRVMKPGGTAIVTTWADASNSDILRETELKLRPHQTPYKWPVNPKWLLPETIKNVMRDAGFEKVEVHQFESARREKDTRTLAENFSMGIGIVTKTWTEDERAKLVDVLCEVAMNDKRYFVDEAAGEVGLRMVANIAVCRK